MKKNKTKNKQEQPGLYLTRFDPTKVKFGGHESFHLRFAWLSKGFEAIQNHKDNSNYFDREEAIVELGVGKNMVRSIRYWLLATQMARLDGMSIQPTELGNKVLGPDGWDPFLEDEGTIWLLHWLLCSSPSYSTVHYWFFNHFHKPLFTNAEAQSAFSDFCKINVKSKFSVITAKKDTLVLLRMYSQSRPNKWMTLEDALDSPFSLLRIVGNPSATSGRSYQSTSERRDELPDAILALAIAQLFEARGSNNLPLDQLMYSRDGWIAPGSVFRLTESALLAKLEKIVRRFSKKLELREVAGVYQLYLISPLDQINILDDYYARAYEYEESAA